MERSNHILKVPRESSLRDQLRKEANLLAKKENLLPPESFGKMEKLAIGLLKQLKISEEYTNFTIVLLGNESWRKTVEATPFNRRLLLLPQCLKNNLGCKGQFDELGLICAGCKACPIDDILLEAEKSGYATLVAEGTTVAIGLVEEGSIDAVIGVSCMPVLQRSFNPVTNAAIPVIGLPLMYDGCENTQLDYHWLMDEIRSYKKNENFQPISISGVKTQVLGFFEKPTLDKYFSERDETEKLAKKYLQLGGQRMRPLIASLSYLSYTHTPDDEILSGLSVIIESFHKASLIHDDIEDDTDLRYNVETAHKKHGVPQAINFGDLLIGKGYSILSELPVNSKILAKSLKQVSESHIKLTQGQGADILFNAGITNPGLEETIQIFSKKTGEAIKVALLLGAILGAADDSELKILAQFSDLFGIAYQIRDDLNEFAAKNIDEKIADFPFLKAMLNGQSNKDTLHNMVQFRKTIVENQLDISAQKHLDQTIDQCYKALDKLKNAKLRLSLYAVLGKIFKPISTNA